jgi:hypothetical protein
MVGFMVEVYWGWFRIAMTSSRKDKPELWDKKVAAAKDKFGKWSARAAQWAVNEYKKAGGGYVGAKSANNSLAKWTDQEWRTRDNKPAIRTDTRGRVVTARYLPDKTWDKLSQGEAQATDRKKREGSRQGKGVVPNTKKAKQARKNS